MPIPIVSNLVTLVKLYRRR